MFKSPETYLKSRGGYRQGRPFFVGELFYMANILLINYPFIIKKIKRNIICVIIIFMRGGHHISEYISDSRPGSFGLTDALRLTKILNSKLKPRYALTLDNPGG